MQRIDGFGKDVGYCNSSIPSIAHTTHTTTCMPITPSVEYDSMKAETQQNEREKEMWRLFQPCRAVHRKRQFSIFSHLQQKVELFSSSSNNKHVFSTLRTYVLCIQLRQVPGFAPCTHVEGDTRILLTFEGVLKNRTPKYLLKIAIDTEMVVLAVT